MEFGIILIAALALNVTQAAGRTRGVNKATGKSQQASQQARESLLLSTRSTQVLEKS